VTSSVQPEPLINPIYVDLPMLVSLLAQTVGTGAQSSWSPPGLEDALSLLDRAADRRDGALSPASSFASVSYVATGLLNALRRHLADRGPMQRLDGANDVESVRPSELVEVSGRCIGNPLEELLAFFGTVIPQMLEQEALHKVLLDDLRRKAASSPRGSQQGAETELIEQMTAQESEDAAARLLLQLSEDLKAAPVRDVVVMAADLGVIASVAARSLGQDTLALLRGAPVTLIGQVVAVVSGTDSFDLTERTVLGTIGGNIAHELVTHARSGPYKVDVAEPVIEAPAVQILPLAIWI
jgi:hypothetical protein